MRQLEINICRIGDRGMAYRIYGEGKVDTIVWMGLCSSIGEYNRFAGVLARDGHTVLVYERYGCGSSDEAETARTPENIAAECMELLQKMPCREKLILVAHSQGGLYANQFARKYPDRIAGAVFLDPLSARDFLFREKLTKAEYKKSGVDKTPGMKINLFLARLHMGGLIKKMMKEAPPFYYDKDFTADEEEYILDCLTKPSVYRTALEEYRLAHERVCRETLQERGTFPDIPVCLITHSSEIAVREIMLFGNTDRALAEKVESIWQELMKDYLLYSDRSSLYTAENSSHYIHLTDQELVRSCVQQM